MSGHLSHVTTHVLDAAFGTPARGVGVTLERSVEGQWDVVDSASTDADGRVGRFGPERLAAGEYRVRFDTARYFAATQRPTFFPEVVIVFRIADVDEHYHIPLLLSPFAYSTYRGS